ncbi:putative ribonuclease T(2) [Rosa chinensis]|uniref:Putative ribonuclease T(2) n=1 Tax=Rosa chinensis TaxID=74649 RepID=A0A2P6RG95_ROSCH|nr:putative ribonuclease T(2) [Rosa chinensis]
MSTGYYEYFKLVQQWPPTTCQNANCRRVPPPRLFTLHGFWPSNYSNNVVANCTNAIFQRNGWRSSKYHFPCKFSPQNDTYVDKSNISQLLPTRIILLSHIFFSFLGPFYPLFGLEFFLKNFLLNKNKDMFFFKIGSSIH